MEFCNWGDQLVIVCKVKGMFGVKINFDDFDLDDKDLNLSWSKFVNSVRLEFKESATWLLGSIINQELILFHTEDEARRLVKILDDFGVCFSFVNPHTGMY